MLVSEFDFYLPPERIAQRPLAERSGSRLMLLGRGAKSVSDRRFQELPELLRQDDLLVLNDTRVFAARLYGRRGGQRAQPVSAENPASRDFLQGRVEVLLTRQVKEDPNEWQCLVRPGKKIGVGETLHFGGEDGLGALSELQAEVVDRGEFGERRIRFSAVPDFFDRVERIGHTPLPPYIRRDEGVGLEDSGDDKSRYQTVYARERGSVAAPTAGLHFTDDVLRRIRDRGIETASVTLHVGLGTFQPVRVKKVEEHRLHRERYEISESAASAINTAKADGRRIVAVGTTTVRTLEYAAGGGGDGTGDQIDGVDDGVDDRVRGGSGEADIFIYPGYRFRVVDAMLTNFHLPQSTLLMLVSAFGGKEFVMSAYRHAIEAGYRFYSYGDCMLVQ